MVEPRLASEKLKRLIATFPVVVVSGARQVGKTTLLRALLPDFDFVTLDPAIDVESARSEPDLFLANHPGPLVVDEVQYAPPLVSAIKRAVDRDRRPGRFVLTGSQQWDVMKSITESLAGRVVFIDLLGFTLAEQVGRGGEPSWLGTWLDEPDRLLERRIKRLSLSASPWELLWRGQLPDATRLPLDVLADFFSAYRRTYVERDVRMLADVSDLQLFGRFFGLCAALTGQEINASQLGRDLGVTPQTARRWLDLLMATFQWVELPAFSGNAVKRVSGRPKGYLSDTGLVCAAQRIPDPLSLGGHPLTGALFETAIVHELRAQAALLGTRPTLHHWRSHGGAEVDVIIEYKGRVYPVEIKATSHPTRRDARGFGAFREAYPGLDVAPGLVLAPCDGRIRLTETDVALPWDLA